MFSKRMEVLAQICFLLLVPVLLVGCTPEKEYGLVHGKVTLKGQPLTTGRIEFNNAAKNIALSANINEDGTYVAKTYDSKGISPGTYKIAIYGSPISSGEPILVGQENQGPKPIFIPPMYRNPATSGFEAIVEKGENKPFDFDMK